MIAEIKRYIEISDSIDSILATSPLKLNYIIDNVNIKRPTFFKKLKDKRFTPEELLKIAQVIEPIEYSKIKEKESIQRGLKDLEAGRIFSHLEVMTDARLRLAKRKK